MREMLCGAVSMERGSLESEGWCALIPAGTVLVSWGCCASSQFDPCKNPSEQTPLYIRGWLSV